MTRAGMDLAELRRLAEAATPGPWKARQGYGPDEFEPGGYKYVQFGPTEAKAGGYGTDQLTPVNAEYIAAANPATILALLNRIAVARFVAEHWRDSYMEYVKEGQTQYGIGTHPLALVLDALDGETDPRQLGLPPDADESLAAFFAASPDPAVRYVDCPDPQRAMLDDKYIPASPDPEGPTPG